MLECSLVLCGAVTPPAYFAPALRLSATRPGSYGDRVPFLFVGPNLAFEKSFDELAPRKKSSYGLLSISNKKTLELVLYCSKHPRDKCGKKDDYVAATLRNQGCGSAVDSTFLI